MSSSAQPGTETTSTMYRFIQRTFWPEGPVAYFDEFESSEMSCKTIFYKSWRSLQWSVQYPSLLRTFEMRRCAYASIPAIEPKNVIIGQYGKSLDGTKPSYKEDDTVPKGLKMSNILRPCCSYQERTLDGVPFIMKAGKALNEQKTEIRIQFQRRHIRDFQRYSRNELVMRHPA